MNNARLYKKYQEQGKKYLQEKFNYSNPMQVPALEKIVINMSSKDVVNDSKLVEKMQSELLAITGQKPVITKAKKSIAGFKLRQGMPLGCKVTLRGAMMYEFLDRLVNIALPRSRDFRGLSKKQFDGKGNFAMGLKEQIVFPEINYDSLDKVRGMDIIIVTTAQTNEESKELLQFFDVPFIN